MMVNELLCYTLTAVTISQRWCSPNGDTLAVLHHLVHVLHFIPLLCEQIVGPVACVAVDCRLEALCLCGRLMLVPLLLHLKQQNRSKDDPLRCDYRRWSWLTQAYLWPKPIKKRGRLRMNNRCSGRGARLPATGSRGACRSHSQWISATQSMAYGPLNSERYDTFPCHMWQKGLQITSVVGSHITPVPEL